MNICLVRDYVRADLVAVVTLFNRSVREVNCRDYSAEQIAAWASNLPDMKRWSKRLSDGGVFVCEWSGSLAGFARIEEKPAGTACLDLLYVHPEYQGRGLARRLMEGTLAWTMHNRLRKITSEVSITARPFFERMGFRVVAVQTVKRGTVELRNFRMEGTL